MNKRTDVTKKPSPHVEGQHKTVWKGVRNSKPRPHATQHTRTTRPTHFSRIATTSPRIQLWRWRRTTRRIDLIPDESDSKGNQQNPRNPPTWCHRTKCSTLKYPNSEGPKTNSMSLNIYSSTTCNPVNTGSKKETNYTTSQTSWEMKPLSFGKHWESTQKPPLETSSYKFSKKMLPKIS